MASIFLTGVGANSFKLTYNGVDLTSLVRSVTINQTFDDVEITAMGAVAKAHVPGLREDSVDVEFYQSYAASETDQTLNGLLGSTAGATLVVQTNATVSATQPKYSMIAGMYSYNPIAGQVGAVSVTTVTFRPAAGQYIVRGTV